MIIVTSGSRYLDIDAYACMIAYAELLNALGKDAKAVSTAPLNESITRTLRDLPAIFETNYQPSVSDTFVLVDVSEPDFFDTFVDYSKIIEVFDHHPGLETFWAEKLGQGSHIEFIGAAATLIFEQWQQARMLDRMSQTSAHLLAAAILDNTLNFGASVTTKRDIAAFDHLKKSADINDEWVANYFTECQQTIEADLKTALQNDTKVMNLAGAPSELCVGQMVVWDAHVFIDKEASVIKSVLGEMRPEWFANIVSIAEGRSYFLSENLAVQQWLGTTLGVIFEGDIAKADRLWLRKEIMKTAQSRANS